MLRVLFVLKWARRVVIAASLSVHNKGQAHTASQLGCKGYWLTSCLEKGFAYRKNIHLGREHHLLCILTLFCNVSGLQRLQSWGFSWQKNPPQVAWSLVGGVAVETSNYQQRNSIFFSKQLILIWLQLSRNAPAAKTRGESLSVCFVVCIHLVCSLQKKTQGDTYIPKVISKTSVATLIVGVELDC